MIQNVRWGNFTWGFIFLSRKGIFRASHDRKRESGCESLSCHNIDHSWLCFTHHEGFYQIYMSNWTMTITSKLFYFLTLIPITLTEISVRLFELHEMIFLYTVCRRRLTNGCSWTTQNLIEWDKSTYHKIRLHCW